MCHSRVSYLFAKPKSGQPTLPYKKLTLETGVGIVGDAHAAQGSPRQILLVGANTLQDFKLNPGELRENILIDGEIEQFSSGQVLQIGEALIRLTFLCEPCKNLEQVQLGLTKRIKNRRGMLGIVVGGGEINIGDQIVLTSHRFSVFPDNPKERFQEFVKRIPFGKVVTTSDLLLALGLTQAYYRAIGNYIKQTLTNVPSHRLVKADGTLLTKYILNQAELLKAEGVKLNSSLVVESHYYWDKNQFHHQQDIYECH
ncbi:MOSC domain-containing protein [Gloeothece verrucosa]|uniref:MOSC domain-containing protein n=1 Tax=Gloeothece verrucosa (strain PCC 7822) TaxID=497965 RepID=E0UMR8_GLOV7|nr:MGMT family protein [Gloeothece verrucosa]ADN18248.1 conserved hypothetical protein [Gloeothece verrucosa PCC 7822]